MRTILLFMMGACAVPTTVEVTHTKVSDRAVTIEVLTQPLQPVVVQGQTERADEAGKATFVLMLNQLDHGTNQIEIKSGDGTAVTTAEFALDLAPQLIAISCPKPTRKYVTTGMVTPPFGLKKIGCPIFADGTMPMVVEMRPGNTITLGEAKGQPVSASEANKDEAWARQSNVAPSLVSSVMAVKISETFKPYARPKITLPLEVRQSGAEPLQEQVQIELGFGLSISRLKQVANGEPLGEPTPPKSVVYLDPSGYHPIYAGADVPVSEVDLVVTSKTEEARAIGKCGPYSGKGKKWFTREAVDITATVYDRSGTLLETKTIKGGDSSCPFALSSFRPDEPDTKKITRWIQSLIK